MTTHCPTPRPATTPALWFAVVKFATRRGLTRQVLSNRKTVAVYATLTVLSWAYGVLSWGHPIAVIGWFLLPFATIGIVAPLGFLLVVSSAEAWYYSPEPGKQSMVMMWPRWRILTPDKRTAGNYVAEPQRSGIGGPLFDAALASADRRGIWLYGTAADDELLKHYLTKDFVIRSDKPGERRMVRKPKDPPSGPIGGL